MTKSKTVVVNDRMQRNYVYVRSEPVGKTFRDDFCPQLTPKQMLALGVFGGKYLTDCTAEFPPDWFAHAKLNAKHYEPKLNFFGVRASQSLSIWRAKGWINDNDPRGWFQWYCRYYMGRRGDDDDRQIRRWKAMQRHMTQVKANCMQGDWRCRRRQRQALLHWAYDSRSI